MAFLAELKKQKRFVFDLETTGLDPVCASEIVGYAFCWQPGTAYYLPVRGPEEDARLDPAATLGPQADLREPGGREGEPQHQVRPDRAGANGVNLAGRRRRLDDRPLPAPPGAANARPGRSHRDLLGHRNIPISELIGKGKKQITMDTVPTRRVRDYAGEDADAALQLADISSRSWKGGFLRKLYDELEVPLIDVLAEMEFTGIRIDVPFLEKLGTEMATELAGIEKEIHRWPARVQHRLAQATADRAVHELKLPVQKRTGIKNEPSTDQESLERLAALGHELPAQAHRLPAGEQAEEHLRGRPADAGEPKHAAGPHVVQPDGGRDRAAEFERPEPAEHPGPHRAGRAAPQGVHPEGGLEAPHRRLLADRAAAAGPLLRRRDAAAAFAEDIDVHAAVAAEIFKVPEAEVNKQQRAMAKTVNFGVLYGMSAPGAGQPAERSREGGREVHRRSTSPATRRCWSTRSGCWPRRARPGSSARSSAGGGGSTRPRSARTRPTSTAEPGRARGDQHGDSGLGRRPDEAGDARRPPRLKARKRKARMLLTVHDELVFEVPPKEVKPLADLVREEMTGAMKLDVPLKVDVAAGPNWLDVTDV
jgi:DNA polymerase I